MLKAPFLLRSLFKWFSVSTLHSLKRKCLGLGDSPLERLIKYVCVVGGTAA